MISFIWPPGVPMFAGTGGSETYTAGQVKELLRRGIPAQVVSVGHGKKDGRKDFPGVPFLALANENEISNLSGSVVFVNNSYPVPTKNKASIIFHLAPSSLKHRIKLKEVVADKTVIATSVYSGQQWALYLGLPYSSIRIALPFADPIFGNTKRSRPSKKNRIIFAGRLHPDKGIYTILEMMHRKEMQHNGHIVSLVTAGQHIETGTTIAGMLKEYPYAKLVNAQMNVVDMAHLLGQNDILLMPSVCAESFGMLSVEAQHAGCRVVASNIGGIPETNCGLLTLVEPRNPMALMRGIEQAVALGPVTKKERDTAKESVTLAESVDALLEIIRP